MARLELVDVPPHAARRRDVAERQVVPNRSWLDLASHAWELEQRLDLRGKRERRAVPEVIQGLHTHPIAYQVKRARPPIPDRHREHAVERRESAKAVPAVLPQDH